MKLYAAKIREISDRLWERLFPLLDRKRQEKTVALKQEKERLRSIYAGLLLRYAFLEEGYSEEMWQHIEIVEGSHGKPYLSNGTDFFYSLSHSGEWAVCAVDDMETGVDVQKVGALKLAVAKRFYSREEYRRLLRYESEPDRQTMDLYRIWAAKESCVKLTGRGIGAGIQRYVTDSAYTHINDTEEKNFFFIRLYEEIQDYIICACSKRECFPEHIIMITDLTENMFNMGGEGTC